MALSAPTMAVRRDRNSLDAGRTEDDMNGLRKRIVRIKYTYFHFDPFTGFGHLRQRAGLFRHIMPVIFCGLAAVVGVATLEIATSTPTEAQSLRDPIVPGIRPNPRPAPPTRITPRPQFLPAPRVEPGPRLPSAPGEISPGVARPATTGAGCISRCGSQCQSVSCSGLTASQCTSARQRCRLSCRSQCQ